MSEACRRGDPAVAMKRLPQFQFRFEEVMLGLKRLAAEAPGNRSETP